MANEIIISDENINPIFEEIKGLINNSRDRVYSTVNTEMLNLYWLEIIISFLVLVRDKFLRI